MPHNPSIPRALAVRPTRREALQRLAQGGAALLGAGTGLAAAQPASIHDHLPWIPAMREDLGEQRRVLRERVSFDVSPLVDNGNLVPIGIRVQSAMQGADRVKTLKLYSEKNPQPRVATFHFSDYSAEAQAATRIRMNGSQRLVAIAEMTDGRLYAGVVEVVVTITACIDGS